MPQRAFYFNFYDGAAPPAVWPGSLIEIPSSRNIGISAWGYGVENAGLMNCTLGIRYLDANLRWLIPTPWDDSVTPTGGTIPFAYPRTVAEYATPIREFRFDPLPICDVGTIVIGVTNLTGGNAQVEGHVRGIVYG